MFYYLSCLKCKNSTKVSIEDYKSKNKKYCISCLKKIFKKIKSN